MFLSKLRMAIKAVNRSTISKMLNSALRLESVDRQHFTLGAGLVRNDSALLSIGIV